tara:strand:- start:58 stop:501 length:444 start_codon:yes stop_codon:yes gene_type:complete
MNFFARLNKKYYHTDPVEHIIGPQIIKVATYDDLYENQTRFDGTVWNNFKVEQNLKLAFHEDLRDIDRHVDIMCLWFFRERTDRDAGNDIKLAGKIINYTANKIVITPSKDIKIKERRKFFPRRPCVQVYINQEIYLNIKKDLKIND